MPVLESFRPSMVSLYMHIDHRTILTNTQEVYTGSIGRLSFLENRRRYIGVSHIDSAQWIFRERRLDIQYMWIIFI